MKIPRERILFVVSVLGMVFIGFGIIDLFFRKLVTLALAEYVLGMVTLMAYFFLKIRWQKQATKR